MDRVVVGDRLAAGAGAGGRAHAGVQALYFDGGSDLTGAAGNLLRAATAALLNTAHPGVDYPWLTAQVISDVDAALASQDRDTLLGLGSPATGSPFSFQPYPNA